MNETEVKILEINKEEIIAKLESLGAEKVFDGVVDSIFFDFPDNRIYNNKTLLRLRKEGNIKLTFKKKISKDEVKIMDETEIIVDDFKTTKKILLNLGLSEVKKTEKKRISYKLKDVRFEIDTYPGIPTYLEIETEDVELLKEYVKKIGFSMKNTCSLSTIELMEHYK